MLHRLSPVMLSVHKTTGDQFVLKQVFKQLHLQQSTVIKVVALLLLLLLLLNLLPMSVSATP